MIFIIISYYVKKEIDLIKKNKIFFVVIFIFLLFIDIQNETYIIKTLLIKSENNEIGILSILSFILFIFLIKFSILFLSYFLIFTLKFLLFLNIDLILDYSVIRPAVGSILYCGLVTLFILLVSYFNKYIALILILFSLLYNFNKEIKNNESYNNKIIRDEFS